MPAQRDVEVIEQSLARHERLAGSGFLGGATVEPHRGADIVCGKVISRGNCGEMCACAEQMMAAAVSVGVDSVSGRYAGQRSAFLAQSGQSIVLTEKADDRAATARLCHKRCRQSRYATRHAKPFLLEQRRMQFGRAIFAVSHLGMRPDFIGQFKVSLLLCLDETLHLCCVLHIASIRSGSVVSVVGYERFAA